MQVDVDCANSHTMQPGRHHATCCTAPALDAVVRLEFTGRRLCLAASSSSSVAFVTSSFADAGVARLSLPLPLMTYNDASLSIHITMYYMRRTFTRKMYA